MPLNVLHAVNPAEKISTLTIAINFFMIFSSHINI